MRNGNDKDHIHTYIHTLHSIDPKLVRMIVGYGLNQAATKIHITYNWSISEIHTPI
jgi:hypothetical protein